MKLFVSEKLIAEVDIADNFFTRLKGLLGRDHLKPGTGLYIKPCNFVHTFFMRFLIDVIFIDSSGAILSIHENLAPFRLAFNFKANAVIELPAGFAAATGIQHGHQVNFELLPVTK